MSGADRTTKVAVREQMRELLRSVSRDVRATAAVDVAAMVAPYLPSPETGALMGYMPRGEEFDVEPIMQAWLDAGGTLCSPVVNWVAGTMAPGLLGGLQPPHVRMGLRGVREPVSDDVVPMEQVAAVIVPGLAFDRAGRRLGRGGGFYDRFLSTVPPEVLRIGVCFDEQIIEAVPIDGHDCAVQLIVSPTEVIEASQQAPEALE